MAFVIRDEGLVLNGICLKKGVKFMRRKDELNKSVMDKVEQLQVKYTQERIYELQTEMKQAMEEKQIVESFISEQEREIPDIVLVTLKQKIRRLNSDIKVCKARLESFN